MKIIATNKEQLEKALAKLGPVVAFDTETNGVRLFERIPFIITFFDGKTSVLYRTDSTLYPPEVLSVLSTFFNRTPVLIGHNIVFDANALYNIGVDISNSEWIDTLVMSHLLDEKRVKRQGNGLKVLAKEFLEAETTDYERAIKYGVDSEQFYEYALNDAVFTWQLAMLFKGKMQEENLTTLFRDIEMPFLKVLAWVERNGINVDQQLIAKQTKKLRDVKLDTETKILDMLGEKYSIQQTLTAEHPTIVSNINLGSTYQLQDILYKRLGLPEQIDKKTGRPSTGTELLKAIEDQHAIVPLVIKYKNESKLLSSFFEPMPGFIDPDGRVRPRFNDTGTETGRLSSNEPNMQQCVTADTQVLTKDGWKNLTEYKEGEPILSFDVFSERAIWQVPSHITRYISDEVHEYKTRTFSIATTSNHRHLLQSRKSGNWKVVDTGLPQDHKIFHASIKDSSTCSVNDWFQRLVAAIQADGHFTAAGKVDMAFSKKRKYYRIMEILRELCIPFKDYSSTHKAYSNGVRYRVSFTVPDGLYYYLSREDKTFSSRILTDFGIAFCQELRLWDGSFTRAYGEWYCSTNLKNIPIVQALLSICGYRANVGKDKRRIFVARNKYSYTTNRVETLLPPTEVWCPTVPATFFFARRNDQIFITGNCPKEEKDKYGLRKCFTAPEGHKIVSCDYSGQEIRVLAHLSGDRTLLDTLIKGKDLHLATANQFYNLGIAEEDLYEGSEGFEAAKKKYKAKRNQAKTITFGIAYGKAQPIDSLILTPEGWKSFAEIREGDLVYTQSGEITHITKVHPIHELPTFRLTMRDGSSAVCSINHEWTIQTTYDREMGTFRTLPVQDIIPILKKGPQNNCSIPYVEPLKAKDKNYYIDPYAMGLYIGDGDTCNRYTIANDDVRLKLESRLPPNAKLVNAFRYHWRVIYPEVRDSKGRITNSNLFTNEMRRMGLAKKRAWEKFIPREYLEGSIDQRRDLFKGLFDADGSFNNNCYSYTTVSKRLAEDVQYLVKGLGARCTISSRVPTYTYKGQKKKGRLAYTLFISFGKYRQTNTIQSIEEAGVQQCRCISVAHPSGLYVTNDFIVTHNSAYGFALDFKTTEEEAQEMLDKYFAGFPGVKNAIDRCRDTVKQRGYVASLTGRRRRFEKNEQGYYPNGAFRQAFNFLIQGFSADMIRIASIRVYELAKQHPEWELKQIATVHDENLYQVKEQYAEQARAGIKASFEGAVKLSVPMISDCQVGNSYGEAH